MFAFVLKGDFFPGFPEQVKAQHCCSFVWAGRTLAQKVCEWTKLHSLVSSSYEWSRAHWSLLAALPARTVSSDQAIWINTGRVDLPAGSESGEIGSGPWDCDPIFAVSHLPAILNHKYGLKHVYQLFPPFLPWTISTRRKAWRVLFWICEFKRSHLYKLLCYGWN